MKKVKKMLLFLIAITFLNKVSATPVNTSFLDDDFYNCIIVKLNTDGFNSIYDRDPLTHSVTAEELKSITVLKCNDASYSIKDVKGLDLLTSLKDLNLSDNAISSIDLTKNIAITNLLLSNNKLATIDLAKNTVLENLYLDGNKLTTINLKANTNLLVLNINNNNITELDLSTNNKLMDLKATNLVGPQTYLYKSSNLTLSSIIKWQTDADNQNLSTWQNPSWTTKDANIITVNQKGLISSHKSGKVVVSATVEDIYSILYNVVVSELTSDVYNIDETNATISVNDASIPNILTNLQVTNGEAMIYNASGKYVTTGNITDGFKLKVINDAKVLKTYTLSLVKVVANNNLETLVIKDYTIDFDPEKTSYTIIVENNIDAVEITATAKESTAKVSIEGNTALIVGSNKALVTVTGSDATTKVYAINIIKKASEEAQSTSTADVYLKKLEVEGHTLNFDKKTENYTLKIEEATKKLNITAESSDDQANVEIEGNDALENGSQVKIKVTALDGTVKIYTINIEKDNGKLTKLIISILELAALLLLISLCIVLIIRYNKKKPHDKQKKEKKSKKTVVEEKVTTITDGERTIELTEKQLEDYTKSEAYLEKTIRFRRVCPHCGTVNVLTNEKCYMCGKNLSKD